MPVFLYKKHQDPATEAPAHKISCSLAEKIKAAVSVKELPSGALQLNTAESFADIKARFSPVKSTKAIVLPVREWRSPLLLSYPLQDQRSNPAY